MGDIVKGYKATDSNMQCRGYQFELGAWHKHDGEIAMRESGFHFCEYPSGPWSFYPAEGTRIFKVEARDVIKGEGPGSDLNHVAMEIRLVEEIIFTGRRNTGSSNTGDGNTGSRNTGDGNTGSSNTGDWNTGDWNTGDGNPGSSNTGSSNTGDWNTGSRNTGSRNTGDGNATDNCSGVLCMEEQPFIIFDKKANRDAVDFGLVYDLSEKLMSDEPFDFEPFLSLPNATKAGIKKLRDAHIARRAKK